MFTPRLLVVRLAAAFGALASAPVLAQTTAPAEAPPGAPVQALQRVEITGSSIKRIDAEGALPVQVLRREDIERSGAANVEQLLQKVSAATSGGTVQASMMAGATTGGISSASLRGLSGTRTLILINGRRVASYGSIADSVSVDVNAIPLAAIDRIEVLKDGASAVYGSDAVAGVINFVLRRDYRGAEASIEYGAATQSGGDVTRASVVFGRGDTQADGYNLTLVATYQKEAALFGRDRDFARSGINVENNNDVTSGNSFPANIVLPDGRTRNPMAGHCAPSVTSPFFSPNVCRYDPSGSVNLLPKTERAGLFASGIFTLTPNVEAFGELSFARITQRSVIQPVPISDQFALPPNHPLFNVAPYNGASTIVLRPGSPYYPAGYVQGLVGAGNPLPDVLVRYRSVITGDRDLTDTSEPVRGVIGLRGTLGRWDFDTALLHSRSKVTEKVNSGFPSLSAILPLLNSGQVNFFGPNTPEVQALADATQYHGEAYTNETTLTSLSGKVSTELAQWSGGPLALALGAELRREGYRSSPSSAIQSGDISGYGGNFLPVDRSRNVRAAFAELNIPITRTLETDIAVRHDQYEGSGGATTPKVSLRWRPSDTVLVRAAAGEGFRAPSLTELYGPQTTGVTQSGLNDPLRCGVAGNTSSNDCATQFTILTGGNPSLDPEKSRNFTLGVVLQPARQVSVSLDAFDIELKNTIVPGVPAAQILNDLTRFGSLVRRGPVDPAFPTLPGPITQIDQTFLNLGRTRIRGLDLDAKAVLGQNAWGRFDVALTGTYYIKYSVQAPDGSWSEGIADAGSLASAGASGIIPRWRHNLAFTWQRGPWSATLTQNYQTGYRDVTGTFSEETDPVRRVGSYTTYDLLATYRPVRSLELALGVKNVLDEDPPYTNNGGQAFFQAGYDPSYVDPRGRFVYGRVTYKF